MLFLYARFRNAAKAKWPVSFEKYSYSHADSWANVDRNCVWSTYQYILNVSLIAVWYQKLWSHPVLQGSAMY